MVPDTYKHFIFNLPKADTFPKRALICRPSHKQIQHFKPPINGHLFQVDTQLCYHDQHFILKLSTEDTSPKQTVRNNTTNTTYIFNNLQVDTSPIYIC